MVDFGNALTGAATGAGLGSSFGPIGTAAGGVLGGLSGLFGFGKGKKEKIKQMQNYTPDQLQLLNDLVLQARSGNKSALDYLNSIISDEEGAFEDFERPALEQFNQEVIPGILERFTGMGARSSSAVNQTLGQAAKSLSTSLAAQRAGLKQNAIKQLQDYSQMGLSRQSSPYIQGGNQGAFSMLAAPAGQALGSGFMDLLSRR